MPLARKSCSGGRLEYGFLLALTIVACSTSLLAQTSTTGAVVGVVTDPLGAIIAGAKIRLARTDGIGTKAVDTDQKGQFGFLLLEPGAYSLTATKHGFSLVRMERIDVPVTETIRIELHLELPTRKEQVQVSSSGATVDLDNAALGREVSGDTVRQLPLVTRNFTQVTTLSPGVTAGVYNAGELGAGGTALSQIGKSNDGIYAHGARSYDNNWQIDGISVSDVLGSGAISGGIAIPNPDTLQEFKVQTGMYDAAFGRGSGANVSVITKAGTNHFHGTVFEFLRNKELNANDYFLKQAGQARPVLDQNQFGMTMGGPIRKDKVSFFASYQGTRQKNGLAAGQTRVACSGTLSEPALTDDRSAAALGRLFGGKTGALGGVAVAPDGSNINPVALQLLNFKLPNGSYLIPTPQRIKTTNPFASQGFSAFSQPCRFDEDQGLLNLDWDVSTRNSFSSRMFFTDADQFVTFPGGALNPVGNIQGFQSPGDSQFLVYSLAHRYQGGSSWITESRFGFVRTITRSAANAPFKWSDVGVSEGEMNGNNELPSLSILGSVSMATVLPRSYGQDSFVGANATSLFRGKHALTFGGSVTRFTSAETLNGAASYLQFLSWPDFLLGMNAADNGTGRFSNVYGSSDIYGLLDRKLNAWEGAAFIQDSYRAVSRLTLTIGMRYERIGQFSDSLGRASSFDISIADPHPEGNGSLAGYIVGSNYPGTVPAGVKQVGNSFATYGKGQNAMAPRVGFAWQVLPHSTRLALKGGYGIYYSRPTGQTAILSILAAPFGKTRFYTGTSNAAVNFQSPFAQPFPQPASFPSFVPYSPTSFIGITALSPNFQPAMTQQFSLGAQWELHEGSLLDVGYVGAHGTHLQRYRSLNQALSASPDHPIDGLTTNTLANIGQRVPVPGVGPDLLRETESEGSSWYNGLEVSVTSRLAHRIQLLASYTFSKTLDTDGADVNSTAANNALTLGDQNSAGQRWGRASFDRTHRFVLSSIFTLPSPSTGVAHEVLGGWSVAAIATIQSGTALTISNTNSTNVFGISEDRAQLSGNCSTGQLVSGGSIQSKLNNYFTRPCFSTPPVIGADGIGTGFGDSGTGIVDGPGQANVDLSVSKRFGLSWPWDDGSLQVRAEFFNAFNHPQFSNPDTNFSSPTFGAITSTAVSPRVGQLAVKLTF